MLLFWAFTEKSDFKGGALLETNIWGGDCLKGGGLDSLQI